MALPKFGQEKGRKSGPHSSTTTVGENVQLKMSAGGTKTVSEKGEEAQWAREVKLGRGKWK